MSMNGEMKRIGVKPVDNSCVNRLMYAIFSLTLTDKKEFASLYTPMCIVVALTLYTTVWQKIEH